LRIKGVEEKEELHQKEVKILVVSKNYQKACSKYKTSDKRKQPAEILLLNFLVLTT
jgi:hypothetical protein